MPSELEGWIEQAKQHIAAQRYDQGLEAANRALAIAPNDPMALHYRADASLNRKDFAAAIADNGGCRGCHGEDLTGRRLAEGVYEGRIVAPSLTPEGPTATWSATDALRLLRHGERPDGSLVLHPLRLGAPWSDVDISDLWAFLRTLPPSSDGLPPTEVGLPLRAALGVGLVTLGGSAPADGTEDRPFGLSGRARPEGCEACHGPHTAPVAFGDATWGAAVAGAALLTAGQAALDDAIQRNIGFDGRPLAASAHAGLAR